MIPSHEEPPKGLFLSRTAMVSNCNLVLQSICHVSSTKEICCSNSEAVEASRDLITYTTQFVFSCHFSYIWKATPQFCMQVSFQMHQKKEKCPWSFDNTILSLLLSWRTFPYVRTTDLGSEGSTRYSSARAVCFTLCAWLQLLRTIMSYVSVWLPD